jgi:ABC-type cobalt transport system substrate-binding protein
MRAARTDRAPTACRSSAKSAGTRRLRPKELLSSLALPFWLLACPLTVRAAAEWAGVDEKVIESVARDAGRPAREPLIDTDRGDLLLFVFLVAGAAGGFLAGYCYRALFPPDGRKKG